MPDTPISLLERLRLRPDSDSWQRLVELYTPLMHKWVVRYGIQPADADDLVQEMLAVLIRELPQFRHDLRRGAFRRGLRGVAVNRLRCVGRSRQAEQVAGGDFENLFSQLEDANSDQSRVWDQEHDQHVICRLLQLLEPDFEPATWQAFQ